jgi:hypothetical protein
MPCKLIFALFQGICVWFWTSRTLYVSVRDSRVWKAKRFHCDQWHNHVRSFFTIIPFKLGKSLAFSEQEEERWPHSW